MHRAERLIALDGFKEILEVLTAKELAVVALLLDGMTLAGAGELLGISRQAAQRRMNSARRRLVAERPELARRIEGKEAES